MMADINRLVDYIVNKGIEKTNYGNWYFELSYLARFFELNLNDVSSVVNNILLGLEKREEVDEVNFLTDSYEFQVFYNESFLDLDNDYYL